MWTAAAACFYACKNNCKCQTRFFLLFCCYRLVVVIWTTPTSHSSMTRSIASGDANHSAFLFPIVPPTAHSLTKNHNVLFFLSSSSFHRCIYCVRLIFIYRKKAKCTNFVLGAILSSIGQTVRLSVWQHFGYRSKKCLSVTSFEIAIPRLSSSRLFFFSHFEIPDDAADDDWMHLFWTRNLCLFLSIFRQ